MCDLGTLVELTYARYREQGPAGWWQTNVAAAENGFWTDAALKVRFAHIVHSCPPVSGMAVAFKLAQLRNCEYVFITDRSSSAYGSLPSYWDVELRLLSGVATPEQVIQDVIEALEADIRSWEERLTEFPPPTPGERAAIMQRIHALEHQLAPAKEDLDFCTTGIG